MSPPAHFSQSYVEARGKFLAAATMRGAKLLHHEHPSERGAVGEKLSIDIALLGTADSPGLLLMISGTHGVEGFCGSGCQVAMLHDQRFIDEVERSGVSVLMLHALNPYGFSHLRRVNEDNEVLRAVLHEHASEIALLGWVDFHTGLGPRGHGEKIYAGLDYAADVARTKAWWGSDVTSFLDGTSTSAPLTGINGTAARDECPNAAFAGIALEYGTYPVEQILEAFRAEHWLHNHPKAPKAPRDEIKRNLRDMFYVDADDWKEMVYEQAVDGCLRAIEHLGETRSYA